MNTFHSVTTSMKTGMKNYIPNNSDDGSGDKTGQTCTGTTAQPKKRQNFGLYWQWRRTE